MEENSSAIILDSEIVGLRFCLASPKEISTASFNGFPIAHISPLSNSYLGLPLECGGSCGACGTNEPGKCEGHFGYIELPVPIYHPSHIDELKRLLSLLCLKCLKLKNKFQIKSGSVAERLLASCCENSPHVSIDVKRKGDSACYLELKQPSRQGPTSWKFLERYGFRYGDHSKRTLLPCEVVNILKKIPAETRRKLSGKGFFPQEGYILHYLPVPPNCLSVPDISDGVSVMSSDLSTSMLKKVLKQTEIISKSRSGTPNFESHEVEANDLQFAVEEYLQVRGTVKASRNIDARYGVSKDSSGSSTKAWLEKMRTLFIRKGSGFSSRSVITGDPYKRVNEIGIPSEIAQRITFEERVNSHNMTYLQNLVDNKMCLTYRDGSSAYSLREGSKGHTFLRPGQVVHRRIMDGDIVFINRPPTTHKHSLQALSVYVHDDHTVKINPLICGPLSADFDGDCIHLFYPQSLAAKAEVLELFSVEKQLLSSHNGNLNLQLATDSLLSLRVMLKTFLFKKADVQQLSMYLSSALPQPALLKGNSFGPCWTAFQILQTAFPACLECSSNRYLIGKSEILKVDFGRELMPSVINEVVTSIFFEKGPKEVLEFFDSLQPLLMENVFAEGFSLSLEDFSISREAIEDIEKDVQLISPLLYQLRSTYNELVGLQIENHIREAKVPVANFIRKSSAFGDLIDSKSDSAVTKVVQQIGFLGQQLFDKGKFYSKTLVDDVAYQFQSIYPSDLVDYPSAEFGLIKSCFFRGLDPYEEMVHSISTREVIVRSSRGLSEPGTLFKNLMAILRDVVICYDGTVRNVNSNSIIQFQYGLNARTKPQFPAGEPVGVLAATAMSNPAYKAVLDSTPSSNSSWELMKEILQCKVSFKNELIDRRVILYLKDCDCGRKYCQENAAYVVKNHLRKVTLKDAAKELIIEYKQQQAEAESEAGLVGHILLNKELLKELNVSMQEIHMKCQETITSSRKKKLTADTFKRADLFFNECCSIQQSCGGKWLDMPCLMFVCRNTQDLDSSLQDLSDIIYPALLETVIKGDPRICSANIIWVSPDTTTWIRNPSKSQKGELALDVVLEKSAVKQNGDAWRTVMDCCLPVLNLIDTQRSIPYAIKQVQDLLGISCAFEQAVQRLSTSVSMVAKGVLKEHLILLANSMTCAGNLIGFNSGGYKALCRSLNIQVPFTEATLFTPRKCFERAAEKCHVDSLSSIVASCSWGKHVAVGTGSRFDVLWDHKEVGFDQRSGIDVYNFLGMLSSAKFPSSNTACLGEEVDDLMEVDEMGEWSMSPDHGAGSDKPVFEDAANFENDLEDRPAESTWDKVASSTENVGWDALAAWNKNAEDGDKFAEAGAGTTKQTEWSNWGTSKSKTQDFVEDQTDSSGWGMKKSDTEGVLLVKEKTSKSNGWDAGTSWATSTPKQNEWCDWRTNKSKTQDVSPKVDRLSMKEPAELSGWGKEKPDAEDGKTFKSNGWDAGTSFETSYRDSEEPDRSDALPWSGWGTKDVTPTKTLDESSKSGGWNQQKLVEHSPVWGSQQKSADHSPGWGSQQKSADHSRGWDSQQKSEDSSPGWGSQKKSVDHSEGWDSHQKSPEHTQGWGSQKKSMDHSQGGGLQEKSPEPSPGWGSQQKSPEPSPGWGSQQKSPEPSPGWGSQQKSPEPSQGWGSQQNSAWGSLDESNRQASSNGWGRQGGEDATQGEQQHQWGGKSKGSRRWASDAGKKKPPLKSAGAMNDDSSMAAMYTVTRQRLDMFTSEEQDILSEIEPLMQSIRKITHQPGYNDGDPLSASDQSFVLDSVFTHHPDKAAKMGAGVDYVMVLIKLRVIFGAAKSGAWCQTLNLCFLFEVQRLCSVTALEFSSYVEVAVGVSALDVKQISKHTNFQDTRCFYVVSTDGQKQDFSYRKCLESFIKGKYPDMADAFFQKYFRKNRPGGNRERSESVAPDEGESQHPHRERSVSVAPEEGENNGQ
ncbi:RNA polymerase, alpha subunit [Corchorus olitorius]|uniref:DNA-directed RNA polymerase subunit n=1 Tax=Corchorus olitorius TaxID=93759 RepID=A0A1R3IX99_9ROSI|nr:RNA polymerase, alpha subunit [Corchorus olitorius]